MSKMFPGVKTWSPATGCTHGCPYCSVIRKTLPRVSRIPKYRFGFMPIVHIDILDKGPPKADTIFLCYMGDLFCEGFELKEITQVLGECCLTPASRVKNFLLMTKNPRRYREFLEKYPRLLEDRRFIFGSTIETDRDDFDCLSQHAPRPSARIASLIQLRDKYPNIRIAISMEPVLDFNPERMGPILFNLIKPEIVWIGYDGYNFIPKGDEPSVEKTLKFIAQLQLMGVNVVEKLIRESLVTP